jgi:hypothetical protein
MYCRRRRKGGIGWKFKKEVRTWQNKNRITVVHGVQMEKEKWIVILGRQQGAEGRGTVWGLEKRHGGVGLLKRPDWARKGIEKTGSGDKGY